MKPRSPERVRFVLLTTQRTGSTWVLDLLNNVGGIEGHQELFHGRPRRSRGTAGCNDYPRFVESRSGGISDLRPFSTFRYLDGLYSRAPCCGYKLMYSHLKRFREILAYNILNRVRVVHLVRKNHLDRIISGALAEATGTSHLTSLGANKSELPRIDLDLKKLIPLIEYYEKNVQTVRRLLRLLPLKSIEVNYEELVAGASAFRNILSFLGHSGPLDQMPSSNLVKRQILPRSEVIQNYEEVVRLLKESRWERLLR